MNRARIIVICIAAVCAIALAFVVRAMTSPAKQPTAVATAAPAPPPPPMAKVLVAGKDLKPGQRLADADLEWKDWPVASLRPELITDGSQPLPAVEAKPVEPAKTTTGAVTTVTRVTTNLVTGGAKSDYFGAVVREPIEKGQPILAKKIVMAGDSGYMAAFLEPGMRAMAIRVTVETAAGGFILPGDRVDVVLTRQTTLSNVGAGEGDQSKFTSSTVLQNIKVLAIDQTTRAGDDAQAVVGATATVEVTPGSAEALALAKSEGELSLVLRSYADTGGPSGATRARSTTQAVRVYRGGAPEVVVVQ